jgi:hypothetical protein
VARTAPLGSHGDRAMALILDAAIAGGELVSA